MQKKRLHQQKTQPPHHMLLLNSIILLYCITNNTKKYDTDRRNISHNYENMVDVQNNDVINGSYINSTNKKPLKCLWNWDKWC